MAIFRHSKLSVVKLDNAAGTLTDISQYTNEVGLPGELEEVETTCFGSTFRTYIAGFASATISLSGNWDRTLDAMMSALFEAHRLQTVLSSSFEYSPEGTQAGDRRYSGELILTSYEVNSSIDDPVTWSAEFRVSGAWTAGTN
jgi:hypothetical protein